IPLQRGVLVGSAALIASVVFFLQTAGPATSIYLLLTLVMLLWSALPLFFGWLRYRKSRRS
ncbi:MAG TPA: hypothetical protein VK025_00100, partial [Steroidobacter sp.]|nr:hypothetical protein [Steroidobacter sp.]